MKKPSSFFRLTISFLFLFLLAVSSCEKAYEFEEETKKESEKDKDSDKTDDTDTDSETSTSTQLVVKISMSTNDTITEEEIYPIHVYIMDSDGDCCDLQKIRSANQDLEFTLKSGVYSIYAVAGAANYDLPTQSEAKSTTLIQLSNGKKPSDLRLGLAQVSLTKNERTTQTVELSRRTFQLQSIRLEHIPSDVIAVKLRIQPLYKNLLLNGNSKNGSTSHAFSLQKQSDGSTWVNETSEYLFESSSNETTLKVMLVRADSTTTYTYKCTGELQASYRVNITGTFAENGATDFNGTVKSSNWAETPKESFNFGSTNHIRTITESNEDVTEELFGNAPERGTLYNGCFVLRTQNVGDTTVVTLLTPDEVSGIEVKKSNNATEVAKSIKENTKAALNKLRVTGITGWRLPTLEEMQYVEKHLDEINEFIKHINNSGGDIELIDRDFYTITTTYNCGYFFNADDGNIYVYEFGTGINKKPTTRNTYKVRGFATMKFSD